ncbi:MAG: polymer-forming cytoskeletal protein [Limnobacter sp.]|nr:polymer-forming cytoskeletal protein [Limnobacter sp.]
MMPGTYLDYVLFGLTCLVLLTAPFLPAFREWLYPSDFTALPIAPNYSSDIDHFASRLQRDVAAKMGLGTPTGYEDFQLLTNWTDNMDWSKVSKRLICKSSIDSKNPIRSRHPLYVEGDIRSGVNSEFSALYATGDINLGTESEVLDWAHADGTLRLKNNSVALRRVSAGAAIELGNEVWFERLHAPVLLFGRNDNTALQRDHDAVVTLPQQIAGSYADLPNAHQQTPQLFLIQGDCALPPGYVYTGSLVVTGFLTIGASTTVVGDIKVRKGLSIGNRASVQGAITCEKRVYMFKDARAWGPLVSESDILIGSGTVIGLVDFQTTVSARNIIVEEGAIVHGTVWAHEIGMVKAP